MRRLRGGLLGFGFRRLDPDRTASFDTRAKQYNNCDESTTPFMSQIVVVLTTMPDDARTDEVARTLVTEGVAACVNIHPRMESVYRWKGAVERDSERQLVIKTTADRVDALRQRLHELHPYQLPEFLVLPVESGSDAYVRWVSESCGADTR